MSELEYEDLASREVKRLQEEMEDKLRTGWKPEIPEVGDVETLPYHNFFKKIEFKFRPEDGYALTQIKSASRRMVNDMFSESINILDRMYESIRVVEVNEYGQRRLDEENRVVWAKDENGVLIEKWGNLTGQDLEEALFALQRVKFVTSQRLADLFLDAVYARQVWDDIYHEKYESIMEGTIGERTAKANRESRRDKYFAYFRYNIFYKVNEFSKELTNFMRLLEKKIEWEIRRSK